MVPKRLGNLRDLTTDNEYDADGNVTSIQSYDPSSTLIEGFTYAYDRAGNLSSETDTQLGTTTTTTYSYDDANQLVGTGAASYSYDANGNRTMSGYTTGPDNELTSDGTYDYTYDASGNEITKTDIATGDTWTYGYNTANELVSAVETTSGSVVEKQITYEYDVFGLLIEEDATVGCTTTTTRYAYDGWNPAKAGATGTAGYDLWAVFNSLGSLTSRQLQGDGIDQHLAYTTSSGAYWYLTDHLGSTRSVIDNSGTVQDSLVYDAYGNITYQTPSPSTSPLYTWDGYDYDAETGYYKAGARVYDPASGRWITQDPLGFDAGDSNLYRYVNNRPTIATDPSGLREVAVRVAAYIGKHIGGPWLPEPGRMAYDWEYHTDMRGPGGNFADSRLKTRFAIDTNLIGKYERFDGDDVETSCGVSMLRRPVAWHDIGVAAGGFIVKEATAEATGTQSFKNYKSGRATEFNISASGSYPFSIFSPNIDYDLKMLVVKEPNDQLWIGAVFRCNLFPDYEVIVDGKIIMDIQTKSDGPGLLNLNIWKTYRENFTING